MFYLMWRATREP